HYLRAKAGDAESIAPSLYVGRFSRRRTEEEVVVAAPEGNVAPLAVANDASDSTPVPSIVIENKAGLPLGNPYTS
ncbi:MAG TPA: hypothetical protein VJU61_13205, partial [Polyangiaceae bacterium]|nr:hypothetical protein [Polyangiaceae bacterium]